MRRRVKWPWCWSATAVRNEKSCPSADHCWGHGVCASPFATRPRPLSFDLVCSHCISQTDFGSSGFPCPERQFSSGRRSAPVPGRHHLGRPAGMVFSRSPEIPLSAKLSPANRDAVRAPAVLRRERRWVRSAFGGEFNAVLVAPSNSAEGRNLAAGMERQPGRSAAVCRSVARGVLGQASLSAYGSVRWLKVWLGGGCHFSATE
jgi:hypothetical protein